MRARYDFAVIGAGIAGASVAAELAADASVLLLDKNLSRVTTPQEGQPPIFLLPMAVPPFVQPPPPVNPSFDRRLPDSPRLLC